MGTEEKTQTKGRPVKDLYLAAAFVSEGNEVKDVEFENTSFIFYFEADKVKKIESDYWNGKLAISDLKKYTDVVRELKSRMRTMADKK